MHAGVGACMCACNRDGREGGVNGERGIEKKRQRVRYNNIPYISEGRKHGEQEYERRHCFITHSKHLFTEKH